MINRKTANNQVKREKENSKRTLLFEPYHKISDYYAFTAAISYLKF